MNSSWTLRLLKGLLACSSAQWRTRFEEQAAADLEDAWDDLPVDQRLGWVFSMGWDLVKGAVRSHLQNPKKPQAVLATSGGGMYGPVDVKEVLRFVAFRLPPLAGAGAIMVAGSFLLGMGVYDLLQFKVQAFLGMALVFIGLPGFHRQVKTLTASSKKTPTEQVGLNAVFLVVALSISLAYVVVFEWISKNSSEASGQIVASSIAATMPMTSGTLVLMVGLVLVLSVVGILVQGHGSRVSAVLCLAMCFGFLGAVAWTWNPEEVSKLGLGVLSLPLWVLLGAAVTPVGKHLLVQRATLFLGLGSLPMLLGFLMAMVMDVSKSNTANTALGEQVSWSALDLARAHANSLAGVRASRVSPETFWVTVQEIEKHRQEWAKNKPWVKLLEVRPVGVSAMDWCMALRANDADFGAQHCANEPAPERWLIENPAD